MIGLQCVFVVFSDHAHLLFEFASVLLFCGFIACYLLPVNALAVCRAHRGLPVGFLLLRYSVLFTVES